MEQWTAGLGAHREYGNPLGPANDVWYHSRNEKQSILDKYPGQTRTENISPNGGTEVDAISQ